MSATIGLARRLSKLTRMSRVRELLTGYLDEDQKHGYGEALGAFPGEIKGVRCFGFLAESNASDGMVSGFHPTPGQRLESLVETWGATTRTRKVKAHHYVFSISPQDADRLRARGVSVDHLLVSSVVHSFLSHQERFHPGERYGYALGVHHDREHTHCHVLLHPTTESGRGLRLSTQCSERPHSEDAYHYIRTVFEGLCQQAMARPCLVAPLVPASESSACVVTARATVASCVAAGRSSGADGDEWQVYSQAAEVFWKRVSARLPTREYRTDLQAARTAPLPTQVEAERTLGRVATRLGKLTGLLSSGVGDFAQVLEQLRPADHGGAALERFALPVDGSSLVEADRIRCEMRQKSVLEKERVMDVLKAMKAAATARQRGVSLLRVVVPAAVSTLHECTCIFGRAKPQPLYLLTAPEPGAELHVLPAHEPRDLAAAVRAEHARLARDFSPAEPTPNAPPCPLTIPPSLPSFHPT